MLPSAGARRRTRTHIQLGPTLVRLATLVAILAAPSNWWTSDIATTTTVTASAVLLFGALVAGLAARPLERRLRDAEADVAALESELDQVNHELEQRVGERTSQLIDANRTLHNEIERRARAEIELRQAQKLEAVGSLAAGIAHEINTPVQFASDSCSFLETATADLAALIDAYRATLSQLGRDPTATATMAAAVRAKELEAERELTYLLEQVPLAIARSQQGLQRVAAIVEAMKEFAYPDSGNQAPADLNRAILSTLTIARNEYKYVAEVTTELAELPPVTCHIGELNQVMLNMIINAAQAIAAAKRTKDRDGVIAIRTRLADAHVEIEIEDNGCGIAPVAMGRIFDPFFGTRDAGKGTGQGLAIARSVVEDKHGGRIDVISRVGFGTTFAISLPVHGRAPLGAHETARIRRTQRARMPTGMARAS